MPRPALASCGRISRLSALLLLALSSGCASRSAVVVGGTSAPAARRGPPSTLGIPPGHFPPPGECRIWLPGEPAGHQPAPARCGELATRVPAGAWLVYAPVAEGRSRGHGHGRHGAGVRVVRVTVWGDGGPDTIGIFDAATGRLLREEAP